MLSGSEAEVAARIAEILAKKGLVKWALKTCLFWQTSSAGRWPT